MRHAHVCDMLTCPAGLETITRLTGGENESDTNTAPAPGITVCVCVNAMCVYAHGGSYNSS